jgi:type I restriction enzyme S subunit
MKNISQDRLLAIPIQIPPVVEQRKIAEILLTWDKAIEKLEALYFAKSTSYELVSDALMFKRRRLTGFVGDWPLRRLGEVTRELTRRNSSGKLGRELVMGVTNSRGIVPMRDQTIGVDLKRYQILPPRAFAYNPMRINVGSIAMSRLSSEVLVSPDYVLFESLPGALDSDYLDHLRQSHFWSHYINAGGSGSVRMRTYYADLAVLKLQIPDIAEQMAISAVLNTMREEINLIEKQRAAISEQKRGLMQKLLTGVWRVQLDGSDRG